MIDIAHLLRPAHLKQLSSSLKVTLSVFFVWGVLICTMRMSQVRELLALDMMFAGNKCRCLSFVFQRGYQNFGENAYVCVSVCLIGDLEIRVQHVHEKAR
jgi:hypothetical protein